MFEKLSPIFQEVTEDVLLVELAGFPKIVCFDRARQAEIVGFPKMFDTGRLTKMFHLSRTVPKIVFFWSILDFSNYSDFHGAYRRSIFRISRIFKY